LTSSIASSGVSFYLGLYLITIPPDELEDSKCRTSIILLFVLLERASIGGIKPRLYERSYYLI
jgi:hypothetical protein